MTKSTIPGLNALRATPVPRRATIVGVAPQARPPCPLCAAHYGDGGECDLGRPMASPHRKPVSTRYSGAQQDHLAVPVLQLTLTDIRARLDALTCDALRALDQGDVRRAKSLVQDARLLGRAISKHER